MELNAVNQLFFATTTFCDLLEVNWFGGPIFRYQDVDL